MTKLFSRGIYCFGSIKIQTVKFFWRIFPFKILTENEYDNFVESFPYYDAGSIKENEFPKIQIEIDSFEEKDRNVIRMSYLQMKNNKTNR